MADYITATFKTRTAAESALLELEKLGVKDEKTGLIVTDETRGSTFNIKADDKSDEGLATGASAGGIIGAVIGALSTATTMTIPGVNLVVTGIWVSTLAGLGAGAATGGLIGGLIGTGMTEHEAKILEDEVKNGNILLAVKPENDEQRDQIRNIFEQEDAYNLAA